MPTQFPYERLGVDVSGLTLDLVIADELGQSWYGDPHTIELPEIAFLQTMVLPGETVVDCGAHHGLLSLVFSHLVGPTGQVIAYEALPSNADVIRRQAELNNRTNITVRPVGISDRSKSLSVNLGQGNVVVKDSGVKIKGATTKIDLVSLDEDLPPSVKVDLLKMDVEGSDVQALNGARRIIEEHRPKIDFEVHNLLFKNRKKALRSIFSIISPDQYEFAVLPTVSGEVKPVGRDLDLSWLERFENPHVFCFPLDS